MVEEDAEPRSETASEVRHRAANTLQLLSTLARMRGQNSQDAELRRQMVWMSEAIGVLGALERERRHGGVDFAAYLNGMAPVWRRRIAAVDAEVRVDAVPFIAREQAASSLALIANELVANALQHGAPAEGAHRVAVRLAPGPGEAIWLSVDDTGPGLANGAFRERFGLWLTRSLARQVQGAIEIRAADGGGARVSLQFPR